MHRNVDCFLPYISGFQSDKILITTFQPDTPATRWDHLKVILILFGTLIITHVAGFWSKYFEDWMNYFFVFGYCILLILTFAKKIILSFEVNQFTQTLTIHYFRLLTAPSTIVIPFENLRYQFTTIYSGSKDDCWYFSIRNKKMRVVAVSEGEDGFNKELLTSLKSKLDGLTSEKYQHPD